MTRPLRSLSGLLDFECAARWGSFKLAAHELHKTAAAISQQVKQLEEGVGFALFIRYPRHVELTEKGRELAGSVAKLLGDLQTKIGLLQDGDEERILRVSATHSFAIKWLVPRMHRFTEMHPEFDLRIDSNDQRVNLDDVRTDVAIRYGEATADDPGVLFRERLVVAYSPALLAPGQGALTLADLPKFALLHEGSTEHWIKLLNENKVLKRKYDFSRTYSHSGVLTQAAVAGHGIALLPYLIAHEDLTKGALKRLPCRDIAYDQSYRLLVNRSKQGTLKIKHFRTWIQREMELMTQSLADVARVKVEK